MRYLKEFAGLEELKLFVDFHREETGLLFSSNRDLRTAWIDVEETVCRELRHADLTQ
jgi:hypothetical protein